ncbi:hypothetical protein [Maridesulfovibrio salexigens]|uniref:Uncharacterized protein n=1 Tax=Maridesulfovibrio salexigens (strain ATCC 14822 / DSM 2638 / NCIMB 8403 / VKM B-1763) TaxID=526222 RepID=C6BVE2_MARSD|nr:hypothetical protein [Maridesulfovibrio salexigens]ACS80117.1 hypothetical protein Desal_2057 [Maridesulfovibrio salexigens DSM 2638]
MWKSIVVTTALLFFGSNNLFAADFGYIEENKPNEKQTVASMEKEFSFTDFVTGLDITDDMKTGLIFGLDNQNIDLHAGPDAPPSSMGLGLGFSFSF